MPIPNIIEKNKLKKEAKKHETFIPNTGVDIRIGGLTYFWNKIFYNMWKFSCWAPLSRWFLKKDAVQKMYKERGVDNIQKELSNALYPMMYSHAFYGLLMLTGFLFLPASLHVGRVFFEREIIENESLLVAIFAFTTIAPTYALNSYLLGWKKERYITYFKVFEKESKKEKRKWKCITIFTVLLMLGMIVTLFIILL